MVTLLLKKEFLELKREQKLVYLLLIFIFLAVFSVMITKLTPMLLELMLPNMDPEKRVALFGNFKTPTVIEYVSMYHKNMTQLGVIIITLAFNDNIVKEISGKSIYNLLSLGINRKEVILSKSIAMSIFVIGLILSANLVFTGFVLTLGVEFSLQEFFILFFIIVSKFVLLISMLTLTSVIVLKGWGAAISALGFYALFNLLLFVPILKYVIPFYYWKGQDVITMPLLVVGVVTLLPWIFFNNACSVHIIKKRDI